MSGLFRNSRSLLSVVKGTVATSVATPKNVIGLTKGVAISPILGSFVGASQTSRAQASRKIWEPIKAHNFQSLTNTRDFATSTSNKGRMKFKTCRLLLENVWKRKLTAVQARILRRLKMKNRALKRNISSKSNLNSYIQLQTTRKLAIFYGRIRIQGKTVPCLLDLERRLDVILVRIHFCETLPQARQLINHRKVLLNNRIANRSHFRVFPGDLISLKENPLSRKRRIESFTVLVRKSLSSSKTGRDRLKMRETFSKLLAVQKVLSF